MTDEVMDVWGKTFTDDKEEATEVLLNIQQKGADWNTPLVDAMCESGSFVKEKYIEAPAGIATVRVFTDGKENQSIGVGECPDSCDSGGFPGQVPWDYDCRPGTCPGKYPKRNPENCTECQKDLFYKYCEEPIVFLVEYFGPAGTFSPLPPDAGYFLDLAEATSGIVTWNGDDGSITKGIPENLPPIVDAGEFQTVECKQEEATPVTLYGSARDELSYNELTFTWMGPFLEGGGTVHEPQPTVTLRLGHHMLKLFVWDGYQQSTPAVTHVKVSDNKPPTVYNFQYSGPTCLWPPNHKYVVLRVGRDFHGVVEDTCDPNAQLVVASAESNQPDNDKGDGDTVNDVVVFPDRVCLRSERQGKEREGRLYTIYLGSRDSSGNESDYNLVNVLVPHDQRRDTRCPSYEGLETVEDNDPICNPNAITTQKSSCSTIDGGIANISYFLLCLAVFCIRRKRT